MTLKKDIFLRKKRVKVDKLAGDVKQKTAIEYMQSTSRLFFPIKCKEIGCQKTTVMSHKLCSAHKAKLTALYVNMTITPKSKNGH